MRILTLSTIVVATTLLSGCSSTFMKSSASLVKAPVKVISSIGRQPTVAKILCVWEPAEGQGLDEKPARGFAGQIMFFTHGNPTPIKVSGKVRIYEYTDYEDEDLEPKPAHIFAFDEGGWNAHRAEGTLGQTYNVFLPYVKKDKGHAVCALRVEYESEDGRKVSSPFTQVTLVRKTSRKAAAGLHRNIVHTSSTRDKHGDASDVKTDGTGGKPRKLDSMTIKLPKNK